MESFEVVLLLLGCVLVSSIFDQVFSRLAMPLVQIALGAVVGFFIAEDPSAVISDPELFLLIFIAPPSMSELKSRLIHRGTESTEAIERRFQTAFEELEYVKEYDYVVVNDILDLAIARTEDIVSAERCRASRNVELIERLQGGRSAL